MPIFEFQCRACHHQFEALVRTGEHAACPSCASGDLERLLSMFAVSSDSTRQANLQSARKAGKKTAIDKAVADREEIEHHRH
jgi:putative FmdB family regulatory protein